MQKTNTTYLDLEMRAGLLGSTAKSWRNHSTPSLLSAEAVLGVWGYRLIPCPPIEDLPQSVREKLEDVGQDFVSDDIALASMIAAAISPVRPAEEREKHVPLIDYGRGTERGTRRFRKAAA